MCRTRSARSTWPGRAAALCTTLNSSAIKLVAGLLISACAEGWEEALDACPDMPATRREYLKKEIRNLIDNPKAYVEMMGSIEVRSPRWL